jgi:hypothetical protein
MHSHLIPALCLHRAASLLLQQSALHKEASGVCPITLYKAYGNAHM